MIWNCYQITCIYIFKKATTMLRKIITKGIIFNSLNFTHPLTGFSQTQMSHPFYAFATERESQNNSKPPNRLKDKQSKPNTPAVKNSKPGEQNNEKNSDKKRDKVSYRKVQKQKDREISYIIRQFRQQVQEQRFSTSRFSSCIKELANQYRQERHQQFLNQREQLERLMQKVQLVNFKTVKISDLFNMLDFIRIVSRIQTFNKRILQKHRNQVMEAVAKYLNPLEKISTSDLLLAFCKICSMPFPGLHQITIHLHDRMVDMANSQEGLPFSVFQLYILMKSLSKKEYLAHADKRILQIVLVILGNRMQEIDNNLKFQIIKALLDMRLWANITDNRLLSIADQIFKSALQKLKKGNTLMQLQYISLCPINQNQDHREMIDIIFHRLIMQMQTKNNNFNPLRIICNCLKHISTDKITSAQRSTVMRYVTQLYENSQSNQRKQLQNTLIELLQQGFFGRQVVQLNQLMAHPNFQFYWTFAYQYSNQGLVVPVQLLTKKIHSTLHTFKQESNFLKMAYSIAIQVKHHLQNETIVTLHKQILKSLNQVDWQKVGVEWLNRISIYNPQLVRNFYQEYGHIFDHGVRPSEQSLKQQYSKIRGEKLKHLDFWQYLFAVHQFDRNLPAQMLIKMPITAITLPLSKQLGRKNNPFDHKTLMLSAILSALQTQKLNFKDTQITQVINLLIQFEQGLGQGYQSFDQLYWQICDKLVTFYSKLAKYKKPQANFLIMLLLNIQRPKVRNSVSYRNFLTHLLAADGIMTFQNEYSHLKIAISRAALSKNIFSQQYLPRIDKDYLSLEEQNIIKAMVGEFKLQNVNQQQLRLFFRAVKPSAETLQFSIANILQRIEQSGLKSLQKFLIFFSQESSPNSDKVLFKLIREYTKKIKVGDTDFLGVILNLKTFKQLENKLLEQLFSIICKQLIESMSSISLLDHLYFLRQLNSNGIINEEYEQSLLKYTFDHKYRGAVSIDIAWELCKDKNFLTKDQLDILTNYSTFNPNNYLKLIILHDNIFPEVEKLIENLANNQSKQVSDDFFLKYINQKYEQFLKKTKKSDILLQRASQQPSKLLNLLKQGGVNVQGQQISDQKVYIFNEKVVIAFANIRGKNYNQLVEKVLGFLYPQCEVIICKHYPVSGELSQIFAKIAEILHLQDQLCSRIKENLVLL